MSRWRDCRARERGSRCGPCRRFAPPPGGRSRRRAGGHRIGCGGGKTQERGGAQKLASTHLLLCELLGELRQIRVNLLELFTHCLVSLLMLTPWWTPIPTCPGRGGGDFPSGPACFLPRHLAKHRSPCPFKRSEETRVGNACVSTG